MFTEIINHFKSLEQRPLERLLLLVTGLLFFWILEGAIPLIKLNYKKTKLRHAYTNLGFTIIHLVIHTFLALIIIKISDWCVLNHFGVVQIFNAGILGSLVITFLILDFCVGWLVHIAEHKVFVLWRFHVVHHADNSVDVTTGLRHHPIESVLRGFFLFVGILIAGSPMYAVMIYQTILVFATAFTHANINLPARVDNALSYIIVSPNMHKAHHHYKQPYTDSNYGAVLSIWDRILGTFSTLDSNKIVYGLDKYYPNDEDEHFVRLMKEPFGKM